MSTLYISTRPVRAEQYQPGMEFILGRRIFIHGGQASFAPHTILSQIRPGDWVVETGEQLINNGGQFSFLCMAVKVISDAEFRDQYRIFHPGEARWRSFSEASGEPT